METTLHIKNMVCPRCIAAVEDILASQKIAAQVELGKVMLENPLDENVKGMLADNLRESGFELLEPGKSAVISQIKTAIIEQIHHSDQNLSENFSTFLTEKLDQEYTSMSRLFSQVEGITIEKFITRQKVERVKEYLFYDQLTLSEIAFKLNYSSVAYLSAQFKKDTGMTPSEFKRNHSGERKSLDQV